MVLELWNKGTLWDKIIGYHFLPLMSLHYADQVGQKIYYLTCLVDWLIGCVGGSGKMASTRFRVECQQKWRSDWNPGSDWSQHTRWRPVWITLRCWNNHHHNLIHLIIQNMIFLHQAFVPKKLSCSRRSWTLWTRLWTTKYVASIRSFFVSFSVLLCCWPMSIYFYCAFLIVFCSKENQCLPIPSNLSRFILNCVYVCAKRVIFPFRLRLYKSRCDEPSWSIVSVWHI